MPVSVAIVLLVLISYFEILVLCHQLSQHKQYCQQGYTGIKSFSFLCGMQCIVGQKVSTNSRLAALSHCFPSSSCLLLHEYWNLVPNNTNIHVKETKIWLPQRRPTKETETLDACIIVVLKLAEHISIMNEL